MARGAAEGIDSIDLRMLPDSVAAAEHVDGLERRSQPRHESQQPAFPSCGRLERRRPGLSLWRGRTPRGLRSARRFGRRQTRSGCRILNRKGKRSYLTRIHAQRGFCGGLGGSGRVAGGDDRGSAGGRRLRRPVRTHPSAYVADRRNRDQDSRCRGQSRKSRRFRLRRALRSANIDSNPVDRQIAAQTLIRSACQHRSRRLNRT